MKQRFYFDTSVFGGVFDSEFEEETLMLFERLKLGKIICVYSNLTETELKSAPLKIRDFLNDLKAEGKERILVTPEALDLARMYITEKVVGETSFDDCIHIAAATIHKVDLLVS
jgi:predicted nucleic acid-binding protein